MRRIQFAVALAAAALCATACPTTELPRDPSNPGLPDAADSSDAADAGSNPDSSDAGDAGPAPDPDAEPKLPPSSVGPVVPPSGPTVYVDAVNGTPAGTGSAAAPFQTIAAGVAAVAQSGGTVVVRAGRYQGPLQIDGVAQPILVQAAAGERPVLDCATRLTDWQLHSGAVYKTTPATPVAAVFYRGAFLPRARYPLSGYLTTAANATDRLTLPIAPADAAFLADKDLASAIATVRIVDYWWNSVVVKALDSSASTLLADAEPAPALEHECNPNCSFSYVPGKDWGYYLENEPWMMTQPGSWAWDSVENLLYVWLPENADPNLAEVGYAGPADCLAISDAPGVTVQGLTVAQSGGSGISDSSPHSRFNQVSVRQIKRHGFDLDGPFVVDESSVSFTGSAAVHGGWSGGEQPADSVIESSRFTDIGTALGPKFVGAAIMALKGTPVRLKVRNNYFARLAYIGTYTAAGALIEGNTMEDFCLLADDCSGIYVSDRCPGQTVRGNILRRATANLEGKPASRGPYAVAGIYLDDHSRNMTVEGNVVSEVDMGLMLHNSHDNLFLDNQVFAFARGAVWAQEDSNAAQYNPVTGSFDPVLDQDGQPLPSMTDNRFQGNFFADVRGVPIVQHSSVLGDTVERLRGAFSGSGNTYWNLYSPVVVSSDAGRFGWGDFVAAGLDTAPERCDAQTFGAWATDTAGAAAFAASPGNLSSFSRYAESGTATSAVVACPAPSASGGCLEFEASASAQSLLISPTFPVTGQQFYRVHLQVRSQTSPPPFIRVVLRRAAAPWDDLDALDQDLMVQPSAEAWTVSDFYVQADGDVPAARIDLQVPHGGALIVGDLTVTPVTVRPDAPANHFQGLVNLAYDQPAAFACPFTGPLCDGWLDPSDATAPFPVTVAPRSATVLWHP